MINVNFPEAIKLNTNEAVKLAEEKTLALADNSRIIVNSQPTFEKAKQQLIELKSVEKFLTEKKESITKPLNEALKNTRSLFKPAEDKLSTIKVYLNSQILKYNQKLIAEQKEREAEALAKIREEEDKKRKAQEEADALKAKTELTDEEKVKLQEAEVVANTEVDMSKVVKKLDNTTHKIEQIRTRTVKRLLIENVELIPRDYMLPNEALIKQDLMAGKVVPGTRIVEETIAVNSY